VLKQGTSRERLEKILAEERPRRSMKIVRIHPWLKILFSKKEKIIGTVDFI
jgi:hypothetical protein